MKMSNQEILAYWNSNFANFQDTDCQILGQLDQEMQEGESKRLINAPEFYQSNESQDEISTTYSSTASNAAEEKQALPVDPLQLANPKTPLYQNREFKKLQKGQIYYKCNQCDLGSMELGLPRCDNDSCSAPNMHYSGTLDHAYAQLYRLSEPNPTTPFALSELPQKCEVAAGDRELNLASMYSASREMLNPSGETLREAEQIWQS